MKEKIEAIKEAFENPSDKPGHAYEWLASRMGMPASQCHIGMFDVDRCEQVVAACAAHESKGE